ncbi:peptidoglycan recognition family protein [Phycicoccus sp. Soil802]|uniref:peptidoglycan recognition protein family protein n=1 Tax=Phycicoccus sp. Soil802 TaxID=1736414 RepID=UPI0012F79588|nr:peptidoglycan recognition family protein [Phycicoccus sp. Soil802]
MKGGAGYAGGARRVAMATAVVVALLVLGVALDQGLLGRAGSATRGWVSGVRAGAPSSAAPTGAGASPVSPAPSATTTAPALDVPAAPRIVADHLTFGAPRKAETAAYAARHYGTRTSRLRPTMIVLHYSESDTYSSVRSLFEADLPNRGEEPGTCAHFVVDQDGTIHELVPPTLVCRHTVGLNHVAIGIEFVQSSRGHDPRWATQQVLARRAQAAAGVALVEHLQRRFAISDDKVIGHAMANQANEFRDLEGWRNDHVDWQAPEVGAFRRLLTQAP